MNASTRILTLPGPVGAIDVALDRPADGTSPRGVAVVAHPHPLFGGTRDNKVSLTVARALVQLGYVCWRPNFRGVGGSEGEHDAGRGETEDLLALTRHALAEGAREGLPDRLVLAGFSFGSFVQTHVAARLAAEGTRTERMVLVGTATSRWDVLPVPADTLVIHGEQDDTVPLSSVLDWARPQTLPVVVIPGADHFFHRRLVVLKSLVLRAWGVADGDTDAD